MLGPIERSLRVLGIAIALAAAAPAALAAGTVKIGTVIWIGYGPYYVADALDLSMATDLTALISSAVRDAF